MDASDANKGQMNGSFAFPDGQLIFPKLFDFFGILDLDGKVIQLSGDVFVTTGADPRLLTGQKFSETVFWQSSEVTPKLLESSIKKAAAGEPARLTLDFRASADKRIALDVNAFRLPSGAADQIFISGQAVQQPEHQPDRKSASEQLLFAAENAAIGLWYWDFRDDRIYATPRCNELFGLPAYETFRYENYRETIHPDDRQFVDDFLEASQRNGTKYKEEFRLLYPDGSIDWIVAEGRSFRDNEGRPERMMGVVQKITDQKLATEELAMVHERERKAREEAVEANRGKDFFLAFVSHELRSPLNAILGWTRILLSKELDEPARRNALETIERSARFQTKLIGDLVDSARVASGRLRLEYMPTNLYDVVRNSYQAQKPSAEGKNIDMQFSADSESIPLFGDANRLQQVFGNLISNAIKFTPEGGHVMVDVKTADETVKVTVGDSGNGIDPEALPHIFKQFSQGHTTRTNLGLGLGLSIVKILVGKHGGAVHAESEGVGKGSKFTVTLPLTDAPVEVPENSVSGPLIKGRPLEGRSIVIVEDDQDSREVLELFLSQNGAKVKSFDSVRAALANFGGVSNELPNVIISDLGMPDEDGFSFITKIRSLSPETGGTVPAIALSAFTSDESRKRALELGFNKYCTKPFEHDSLIQDLLELLRNSGTEAQESQVLLR